MRQNMAVQNSTNSIILIVAAFALLALPCGNGMADDLLGMYAGGAIGQAQMGVEGCARAKAALWPRQARRQAWRRSGQTRMNRARNMLATWLA